MTETLPRRPPAAAASVIAAIVFISVYAAALTLLFAPGDFLQTRPASSVVETAR